MKRLILAILAVALTLPVTAKAMMPDTAAIGLPGITNPAEVEMRDLRVTYRFDQMNEPGKSAGFIPVQIAAKLYNLGSAQSLTLAVPLQRHNSHQAKVLSVFVNGLEVPVKAVSKIELHDSQYAEDAGVFTINLSKDAVAIVDIRLNQPITEQVLPFFISTASGWSGAIGAGTIEAIVPFMPANWNLEMRAIADDTIRPLTYSENRAAYTFQNMNPSETDDVYWHFANMDALEYFARGNERFQKTQGDAKSYEMMRTGLLDMIPCNGVRMPLASWWRNMYETVTMGVIASVPEGQERIAKAMELWSDDWTVPNESNQQCLNLNQRPERYKQSLAQLLAIPAAERSTLANDALKKHETYMRALSQEAGDGSAANSQEQDLAQDVNISDSDKALMANWDSRFASAITDDDSNEDDQDQEKTSWPSSMIAKLKAWFPNMSPGSQILLFIFLAAMLLIVVAFIFIKWKEGSDDNSTPYMGAPAVKNPVSPSFMPTINEDRIKKDVEAPVKPIASMQEAPKYPPVPDEPRSAESFKVKDPIQATPVINKPDAPVKTQVLDEAYQDKPKDKPVAADPPWIKKETPQELIKPSAPPPNPAPNNLPWQKKNDDNEQPPKPMVNI